MPKDETLLKGDTGEEKKADESMLKSTPEGESTDGAQSEETGDTDKKEQPEKHVPEKYEFQMPEGMEPDQGLIEAFSGVAKKLKLSQEEAAEVVTAFTKRGQELLAAQAKAEADQVKAWRDQVTSTPGYEQELLIPAKRTLMNSELVSPELKGLIEDSYLGNHPEVIKFLAKIQKLVKEDTPPKSGVKSPEKSRAAILFGGK